MLKAFLWACGFGRFATGGRNGKVIYVNTLADPVLTGEDGAALAASYDLAGAGSLRWALTRNYRRKIVPLVSGWVELTDRINIFASMSNFTYFGMLGPGKGLRVRKHGIRCSGASNFIFRYFASRMGTDGFVDDAFQCVNNCANFILDHCSFSWGWDETLSPYSGATNFTVQDTIVSEGCNQKGPAGGENPEERHAYGSLFGGTNCSWFRNLMAHFLIRFPSISSGSSVVDIRDSVFYNWAQRPTDGGNDAQVNLVDNYYKPGPATIAAGSSVTNVFLRPQKSSTTYGRYFLSGNKLVGRPEVDSNQKAGVRLDNTTDTNNLLDTVVVNTPFPVDADAYTGRKSANADAAYLSVLSNVGMSLDRDAVDERLVAEVQGGTVTLAPGQTWTTGQPGIIENPATVGGWPIIPEMLNVGLGPSGDPIPDAWKIANGLNTATNYGIDGTIDTHPQLFDTNVASPTYGYHWVEIYSMHLTGEINPVTPPEEFDLMVLHTVGGTINTEGGVFVEGAIANLEVLTIAPGYEFKGWRNEAGDIINTDEEYAYIMPKRDVVLTAVFEPIPTPPNPSAQRMFCRQITEPLV